MTNKAEFTRQIQHLQWVVLLIHVFVIGIGGCIFGLAVASRPILRITREEYHSQVRSICEVMVATGLFQIIVAGYDIFSACWKLIRPLYLAVAVAGAMVILEIVAIATSSWIGIESDIIAADEAKFQPWFVWDCRPGGSCKAGMSYYFDRFIGPQIGLFVVSVILQIFGIIYLIKLIRTLQAKQYQILKAKELMLRGKKRSVYSSNIPAQTSGTELLKGNKEDEDDEFDDDFDDQDFDEEVDGNSPSSDMNKEELGYVAASGTSLDNDYDDTSVMRHRGKTKDSQSLSFSGNVEIHVFNPHEDVEGHNHNRTSTTQM